MITEQLLFQELVRPHWGNKSLSGLWRLSNPDPLAAGTIQINPADNFLVLGENATGLV